MDELTPDSSDTSTSSSTNQIVNAIADSDSISASDSIKNLLYAKASEAINHQKQKIARSMFGTLPTEELPTEEG